MTEWHTDTVYKSCQDLNIVISVKFHSEQYVLKLQNNCPKMEHGMFACVGFEATFEQLLSKSVNIARSNWSVSWWWSYPVWPSCYFSRRIQHIVLILKKTKQKKETFIPGSSVFSLSSTLAAVHFLLEWTYRMVVILHMMRARWSLAAPAWQFLSHPDKKCSLSPGPLVIFYRIGCSFQNAKKVYHLINSWTKTWCRRNC